MLNLASSVASFDVVLLQPILNRHGTYATLFGYVGQGALIRCVGVEQPLWVLVQRVVRLKTILRQQEHICLTISAWLNDPRLAHRYFQLLVELDVITAART
mgnify:CR=1 FL=1